MDRLISLVLLFFIGSTYAWAETDQSDLSRILKNCSDLKGCKAACLKQETPALEDLLTLVSSRELSVYQNTSREDKIAFWMNAYLVWYLRILADLGPSQKVDLALPPFSSYKIFVLGAAYSPQEMQRAMLGEFKDERLFFLFADDNSGRPLTEKAYQASRMEEVLNQRTHDYIKDPAHVMLKKKELWLSPLFKKVAPYCVLNYGGSTARKKRSFSQANLALLSFLYHHADTAELKSGLEQLNFKLRYFGEDDLRKKSGKKNRKA